MAADQGPKVALPVASSSSSRSGWATGSSAANVVASYTTVALGPGNVNFTPSGTGVTVVNSISGTSTLNPCTDKWVTF